MKYTKIQKAIIFVDIVLLLAMIGIDLYVNMNHIGPSAWTQASDYIALIIMFAMPLLAERVDSKPTAGVKEEKKEEVKEEVEEPVVVTKSPVAKKATTTKKTATAKKNTATKKVTSTKEKKTTTKKTTTGKTTKTEK